MTTLSFRDCCLFLICFAVTSCFYFANGQNITQSEAYARNAYIYKLTNQQAKAFFEDEPPEYDQKYFQTLVDSFPVNEEYRKNLQQGYYLKVDIRKNKVNTYLTSVQDFNVFIFNNDKDLNLRVIDRKGEPIKNANIKVKGKKIRFNESTQTYTSRKNYRQGLMSVSYNGQEFYYNLRRSDNRGYFLRQYHNIMFNTPVKYVWSPVKFVIDIPIDAYKSIKWNYGTVGAISKIENFFVNLYDKTICFFDRYNCDDPVVNGYIITDKPKYRPGDTVKLKAFLLNKRYKPIKKPLSVVLEKFRERKKLGEIKPYADGGYTFEFKLADSLDLMLDSRYTLRLRDKYYNNYESISFYYEDYTLKGNTLEISSEQQTQYKGDSLTLSIEAKDENELFLMDAEVELILTPHTNFAAFEERLFIPDTLWKTEKKLNPKSKTEIKIPPDIFPKANLDYFVEARLKTSDNEVTRSNLQISYAYQTEDIHSEVNGDTLKFYYTINGERRPKNAKIYVKDQFENIDSLTSVKLPYRQIINPYKKSYRISTDSVSKVIALNQFSSGIEVDTQRTLDSIFIEITNPRNLNLVYHTYKINTEIEKGESSKAVSLKYASKNRKNYYLSLSYIWAGEVVSENYKINLQESQLNLYVNQPGLIYPGKTDTIRIKVLDYKDEPVKNVDLSAYGLTKKFKYNAPELPFMKRKRKEKKIINNYRFQEPEHFYKTHDLNYEDWKYKASLDSIIYYDFMYPKDIFITTIDAKNEICQFAPFVMKNGLQEHINVIYVDGNPIYTAWNQHEQRYSFRIKPGYHDIRLRTHKYEFTIDSIFFEKHKKTIFSIDADTKSTKVKSRFLDYKLTEDEKRQLYPRIMMYTVHDNNFLAYLKNKNRYFLLDHNGFGRHENFITGPVYGEFEFMTYDSLQYNQQHESNYSYTFFPKYLRLKSIEDYRYPSFFRNSSAEKNLNDEVLTKELIREIWKNKLISRRLYNNRNRYPYATSKGNATLRLNDLEPNPDKIVYNTIIVDEEREDFRVYGGFVRYIHDLKPDQYKVIFLFGDGTYQIIEDIELKPYGLNVLTIKQPEKYVEDFLSFTFNEILNEQFLNTDSQKAYRTHINRLREAYNKTEPYFGPGKFVSGVITDEDGLPIPGVSVVVKGTTIGTQTDFDGRYVIKVPSYDSELVFSYVGFKTINIEAGRAGNHTMSVNLETLDEVVVTSYHGILRESQVVSASSVVSSQAVEMVPLASIDQVLQGKVAGANISYVSGQPGQAATVIIRGRTSLGGDNEPLYIIDGMPVKEGDFRELSADDIGSMKILKDAAATAIYGNRGAQGVIVITTKNGANPMQTNPEMELDSDFYSQNAAASSIRNNFSDVAYWQPQLRTDHNGEAEFVVTYPDDITSWSTYILAMNTKKQVGKYQSTIKSYKPISARLYTPRFLTEGDHAKAIGKTLNYSSDTLNISTSLKVDGREIFTKNILSSNAKIDTLDIKAQKDTLQVVYKLKQENSTYFDGEKREIPVFKKGVEVHKGKFKILMPDDTLNFIADAKMGKVEFYAEADILNLIETDLNRVINYRYECNEQLASKLNMLISKKEIYKYLDKSFKEEKEIKKIIKTLNKNKNDLGLWGWWKTSKDTNYWISQHVVKALMKAQKAGYDITLNEESLSVYLKNEFYNSSYLSKKIDILSTLSIFKNKPLIDLENEIDSIFLNKNTNFNEKLRLSIIVESFGISKKIKYIDEYQKEDMFGNIYFDDSESKYFAISHNRIRNTLLAYQLIKSVNPEDKRLEKIMLYLLNSKTNGRYVNTYQATNILETLLPELLKEVNEKPEASLLVNGSPKNTYPFKEEYKNENLTVKNNGNVPVYVTAYQSYYETTPNRKSNDFEIQSAFEDKTGNIIKNGEEVTLKVTLDVKKEAEYTMLNIPIPGGFDYTSKPVNYGLEDHREYFKHETSIFCSQLKEGKYTFEIPLIAKYSGTYHLNPAKVELMYFPTFYAHEGIKVIEVE